MTDVLLERTFDPPIDPQAVLNMAVDAVECFELRRVDWFGSLLATDGGRMVCWFRGPDAESARGALRESGADVSVLWPATVHDAPRPPASEPGDVYVMVGRRFDTPVTVDEIQAIEDAGAWCLETRGVQFVRTFFSRERKRMLCLYRAPDVEAVRQAQRPAGLPVESVWACTYVHPVFPAPPPA